MSANRIFEHYAATTIKIKYRPKGSYSEFLLQSWSCRLHCLFRSVGQI